MDSLGKVQGVHSDRTMSMDSVDLSPWKMSMDFVESLDIVHGYSGLSPGSPLRLDNVHGLTFVSLENVHGLPGHYPWAQWKVWTLSTDTLDNVQADLTMSLSPLAPWTLSMDKVHSLS